MENYLKLIGHKLVSPVFHYSPVVAYSALFNLLLARPGSSDQASFISASVTVCQCGNSQSVVIGAVVTQNGSEIVIGQKRPPCHSVGQHDGPGEIGSRQICATRQPHAHGLPVVNRLSSRVAPQYTAGIIELRELPLLSAVMIVSRQAHLTTPALTGLPAVLAQIIGDGSKHISLRPPDIAAPVAIKIHCILNEAAGHELTLPHRSGPRTFHMRWLDVPLLKDIQR